MLTVIFLVVGVFVVVGAVYLAMTTGQASGRHAPSGDSVVQHQRKEKIRGASERTSGGDD